MFRPAIQALARTLPPAPPPPPSTQFEPPLPLLAHRLPPRPPPHKPRRRLGMGGRVKQWVRDRKTRQAGV